MPKKETLTLHLQIVYGNSIMGTPTFSGYACLVFFALFFPCVFFINCYHFDVQPIRISDLKNVDPIRACEYFNNCFKDPSSFTVVIVGNIHPAVSLPLILQYLVSLFQVNQVQNYLTLADSTVLFRVGYQSRQNQFYSLTVMT